MVDEINEDNGWFRLSPEGKEQASKLLEGQTPSSIGESLATACIILTGYEACLREALSKIDEIPGDRKENFKHINELLEKTKDLRRKYLEASLLTKEL